MSVQILSTYTGDKPTCLVSRAIPFQGFSSLLSDPGHDVPPKAVMHYDHRRYFLSTNKKCSMFILCGCYLFVKELYVE